MSSPIGTLQPTRLTCTTDHLPATYNPWLDKTWCICGERTWPGQTSVMHYSVPRYDGPGQFARLLGWDTYTLGSEPC